MSEIRMQEKGEEECDLFPQAEELQVEGKRLQAEEFFRYLQKVAPFKVGRRGKAAAASTSDPDKTMLSQSAKQTKQSPNDFESKPLPNELCLILLEGLSEGKNVGQIRKENEKIRAYSMQKLKNVPKLTLQRLSKIFVELLPMDKFTLSSRDFFEKYFNTSETLSFYRKYGLDLQQTFENLFYIKKWQKDHQQYLDRGYSRDFLPDEIKNKLACLPPIYEQIRIVHDSYSYTLKPKQRRKPGQKNADTAALPLSPQPSPGEGIFLDEPSDSEEVFFDE